jgi:hypothetical protein
MRSWSLSCTTNWKSLELVSCLVVVNLARKPVVGNQCTTSYSKKISHTCSLNFFRELAFGLMGVMRTGVWWTKCKKSNVIWRETFIAVLIVLIDAYVRVLGRPVCLRRTKEITCMWYIHTQCVCVFLVCVFFFHFLSEVFLSLCSYSLCTCLCICIYCITSLCENAFNTRCVEDGCPWPQECVECLGKFSWGKQVRVCEQVLFCRTPCW